MLDLLYPGESLHAAATAKGSGLSARRAGRAALRTDRVLRRYAGDRSGNGRLRHSCPYCAGCLGKDGERHILREDAVRVVRHAEASGDTFLNRDNGHFLASLRPVWVTFWVEYSVEDGVCVVHDAYCHRMEVPGNIDPKRPFTEACPDKPVPPLGNAAEGTWEAAAPNAVEVEWGLGLSYDTGCLDYSVASARP